MNLRLLIFVLFTLIIALPTVFGLYLDYLWFQELEYESVFLTILNTKLVIFPLVAVFTFLVLYLNLRYAHHKSLGAGIVMFMLLASVISGFLAVGGWDTVLKYFNQSDFGVSDHVFNKDIGFYIFSLPFYSYVWSIVFNVFLFTSIITLLAYTFPLLVRTIQEQETSIHPRKKISIFKKKKDLNHLFILGGIVFLLVGAGLFLSRYSVLNSTLGAVSGAGYTDINISLPLITVISGLSFVAGIGFFISPLVNNFRFPIFLLVVLIGTAVVGGIVSFVSQQYVVVPDEFNKESQYIERSIEFTRQAYGLDGMKEIDFPVEYDLDISDIKTNNQTIDNIRLWNWQPLLSTYKQLQLIRTYYDFNDVDVDRYNINGDYRQVLLSVREVNQNLLPEKTWVNSHLVFTHGYGVAMSPAREVSKEGLPELLIKDIPPVSDKFTITKPEIYYGELSNDYVITNTLTEELDYPKGDQNIYTTYQGKGGVSLSSGFTRLVAAINFGSMETLFSNSITSDSRILFHRNIVDRASTIAPFLVFDQDPYAVIDNGKIYWIIDAYTVTDRYPYSESYGDVNYVRNPVKIAVDAYNGDTNFYVIEEEPIIKAYMKIFPDLFKPFSEMPEGLKSHIRYPIDLFNIQSEVYKKYHMSDPRVFYNKEDVWETPQQFFERNIVTMDPYYLIMKMPGEEKEEFMLLKPFTPKSKNNIIGWMSARSDFPNYGERIVFMFPKDKLVFGPMQIEARIDQTPEIAQMFTLWNQIGSRVIRGEMLVIPIEDSLLYMEPIYLRAEQSGALPELKRIIVAFENKITMQETLDEALNVIFGDGAVKKPAVEQTEEIKTIEQLVNEASDHYSKSQEFLRQGDWEGYGKEQQKLKEVLEELAKDFINTARSK